MYGDNVTSSHHLRARNYREIRFHGITLIVSPRASKYRRPPRAWTGRDGAVTAIFEIRLVDVISSVIQSDVVLTSR